MPHNKSKIKTVFIENNHDHDLGICKTKKSNIYEIGN